MSTDAIISVENLGKSYDIGHNSAQAERYTALRDVIARNARNLIRKTRDMVSGQPIVQGDEVEKFWALKDVNFEVKRGEVVGIIGRNGAGKSTLLKILSRITEPTEGRIAIAGRVSSLLEVGTGFHPELSGRENIYLNGAILGMARSEIKSKFDEIVAFAEIERFLDTPVKRYSSGMYVRLAFAVAAHLEPEILVVDEVLAVGDAQFQNKCLGKIRELSSGQSRTVLFVSHQIGAVRALCSRAILLDAGSVASIGGVEKVLQDYLDTSQASVAEIFGTGEPLEPEHPLRIRSASLQVNGAPSHEILHGETQAEVVVEVEVGFPTYCSLELVLKDTHAHLIALASGCLQRNVDPLLAPGFHTLRARLPRLDLASGSYFLDVMIAESGRRVLQRVESALGFTVPPTALGTHNWDFSQQSGRGCLLWPATFAPPEPK